MKAEQYNEELKMALSKLGIEVVEHSFRQTGVPAKSGLCKVKNRWVFILSKHLTLKQKNERLLDCLSELPHDNIYVLPAIRKQLAKDKS